MATGRQRSLPLLDWLVGYQKEWLAFDLIAGLVTAAVVIPKAMAYATIAGLPIQVGLYTALVPMVIYALLGTSRPLSVSTSTTLAILAATQVALVAPGGDSATLMTASATLTVLVGAVLVHLLAWTVGSLEIYLVLNFLGLPVTLLTAVVMESFGAAVKFASFMIPGSLGALEGGNMAIFAAFGYGGAIGLSYTLVRRLREGTWATAGLLTLAALSARPTPVPTSMIDENAEG